MAVADIPYLGHVPLQLAVYPEQADAMRLAGLDSGTSPAAELALLHQERTGASRLLMILAVRLAYEHPGARVLVLGRDLETMRQDWAQPDSGIWKFCAPLIEANVAKTAAWFVGFPRQNSRLSFRTFANSGQVPDATHVLIDDVEAMPVELYRGLREQVLSRPPLPTESTTAVRLITVARAGAPGWPREELRPGAGRTVFELTGRGMSKRLREARAASVPIETLSLRETILRAEPRYRLYYPHEMMVWAGQLALDREVDELWMSAPPGIGKSWIVSSGIPTTELRNYSANQVLLLASTDKLAGKASRTSKRWYKAVGGRLESEGSTYSWRTAAGGGFEARGKGSALLGERGDVLIFDDPFASPIEASRQSAQEVALAIWTALEDRVQRFGHRDAVRILMHQRLDSNDVLGRVLEAEARNASNHRIAFLNLSAVKRKLRLQVPSTVWALHDADERVEGEALCEEMLPMKRLLALEERSPMRFRVLYQGDPPEGAGGDMFHKGHFVELHEAPPFPQAYMYTVRSWDLGGSDKKESDPTASVLFGRLVEPLEIPNGKPVHWVVLDATNEQVPSVGLYDHIKTQAERDGHFVVQVLPQDPGATGKVLFDLFANQLAYAGISVQRGVTGSVEGNKRARATPLAGAVNPGPGRETGSVAVLQRRDGRGRHEVIDLLVDQLAAFTGRDSGASEGMDPLAQSAVRRTHDDLVDAASQGFNVVAGLTGWSP